MCHHLVKPEHTSTLRNLKRALKAQPPGIFKQYEREMSMQNIVYSFDPRAGRSSDEEIRYEARTRHFSPARRAASRQVEDGDEEQDRQVADIMAKTRPLRLRA